MKKIFALCCLLLSLISCNKDVDAPADDTPILPTSVYIRVRNNSPYSFQDVHVGGLKAENQYGDVEVGQNSTYKPFSTAYQYAYIKLRAAGQELVLQPIDFVGETPLQPGRYTYVLDVVNSTGGRRLTLDFKQD